MINFPGTIKVGPYDYSITFPYHFTERNNLLGQHDALLKKIKLSECDGSGVLLPDDTVLWIFLHEVFHAIDEVYGTKLFEKLEANNELDDTMNTFIHGFLQVVRDNDGFIEILETIKKENKKVNTDKLQYGEDEDLVMRKMNEIRESVMDKEEK